MTANEDQKDLHWPPPCTRKQPRIQGGGRAMRLDCQALSAFLTREICLVLKFGGLGLGCPTRTSQKCAVGTEIKFRAEAELDALLFMHALPGVAQQPWTMVSEFGAPDVTFRLKESISIDDLRWIASVIPDAHTIVQTLNTAENYTGERDIDLQIDITASREMPSQETLAKVVRQIDHYSKFSKVQASASMALSKEFAMLYEFAGFSKELLK